MKRFWTALAVAAVAVLAVAGCNDYGNTFQNNTGATILSISPRSSAPDQTNDFPLTVNGGTFVKGTVVQWNGKTWKSTLPTDSAEIYWATSLQQKFLRPWWQSLGSPHHHSEPASARALMAFPIGRVRHNPPPNPLPVSNQYHSERCGCRGATASR